MPRALTGDQRASVKTDLEDGKDNKFIMEKYRISSSKVRDMRKTWAEHGEVSLRPLDTPAGRKPKLKEMHEEQLKQYVADNPGAYLKDMVNFLALNCELEVDESTVWRTCKRLGIAREKHSRPMQRDSQGMWLRTLPRDENGKPMRGIVKRKQSLNYSGETGRRPGSGRPTKAKAAEKLLERTRAFVQSYMAQPRFDTSHDYAHVIRVLALAKQILHAEQAAHPTIKYDPLAIDLAVLMHDVDDPKFSPQQQPPPPIAHPQQPSSPLFNGNPPLHHPQPYPPHSTLTTTPQQPYSSPTTFPNTGSSTPNPQQQPEPDPFLPLPLLTSHHQNPPSTPPTAKTVLTHLHALRCPHTLAQKVHTITRAVAHTTELSNPTLIHTTLLSHPELAIVQDADRLDALGAVGIARAFSSQHVEGGGGFAEGMRTLGELCEELERGMKTEWGRREARVRGGRVRVFGGWLGEEGGGLGNGDGDWSGGGEVGDGDGGGMEMVEEGGDEGAEGFMEMGVQEGEGDSGRQLMGEMFGIR